MGAALDDAAAAVTTLPTTQLVGWVPQPNQRGTIDIISSCVTTLAICVWAMLHLNVPASSDSEWALFLRRLRWMGLGVLAPEVVILFASGQWASARRSVKDMRSLGHKDWTLTHGFFADSGGFLAISQDFVPFPVTAKQLHFLVRQGYAAMPTVSRKEIWDKSKADRFAKSIASAQALWLVTQICARGVQRLETTVLEISTLALIVCAATIGFFWFHKPLGADTPMPLVLNCSVATILLQSGDEAKQPFRDTPLDFIESEIYTSSQLLFNTLWGAQERPLNRIPNDRDPYLHNFSMILAIAFPTAAFPLLHFIAWNFEFPTRTEMLLWRWVCVSMSVVLGSYCFIEAGSIVKNGYTTTSLATMNRYKLRWPQNLFFFIPGTLYMIARVIVIVETIITLRRLPAECFQVVGWSEFLPHL